jgi:hypothetical protein
MQNESIPVERKWVFSQAIFLTKTFSPSQRLKHNLLDAKHYFYHLSTLLGFFLPVALLFACSLLVGACVLLIAPFYGRSLVTYHYFYHQWLRPDDGLMSQSCLPSLSCFLLSLPTCSSTCHSFQLPCTTTLDDSSPQLQQLANAREGYVPRTRCHAHPFGTKVNMRTNPISHSRQVWLQASATSPTRGSSCHL